MLCTVGSDSTLSSELPPSCGEQYTLHNSSAYLENICFTGICCRTKGLWRWQCSSTGSTRLRGARQHTLSPIQFIQRLSLYSQQVYIWFVAVLFWFSWHFSHTQIGFVLEIKKVNFNISGSLVVQSSFKLTKLHFTFMKGRLTLLCQPLYETQSYTQYLQW